MDQDNIEVQILPPTFHFSRLHNFGMLVPVFQYVVIEPLVYRFVSTFNLKGPSYITDRNTIIN